MRDFVLSLSVSEMRSNFVLRCVNDACVGNYAPVYVLVESLGTPLPRVDLKGTWDRGGLGLRLPPPGSTPRRAPPPGAKQSPPTTYGRDGSRTLNRFMVRVLQKEQRERTEDKEINPTARTGERCSASQYVNKSAAQNLAKVGLEADAARPDLALPALAVCQWSVGRPDTRRRPILSCCLSERPHYSGLRCGRRRARRVRVRLAFWRDRPRPRLWYGWRRGETDASRQLPPRRHSAATL